jgi:hypothetical protein
MFLRCLFLVLSCAISSTIGAAESSYPYESFYTKLNLDQDCIFKKPANEEEAGMGSSGICRVKNAPVIYFMEGDLRQSLGFGAPKEYQSFGQFNHMNATIEWRIAQDRPYAAIVRFFIENSNTKTGMVDKASEGQVLVIHRVAENLEDETCIVGLVDAKANRNANVLARKVADELASSFECATDRPKYHGKRGRFAGDLAF